MARHLPDQNSLGFFYESGTYANPTGGTLRRLGLVQSNAINESTNVIQIRHTNTGNRNIGRFTNGPLDYDGTFTTFPQDWRMLAFALGSNVDAGSPSPYTHTISELNSASGNAFTSGTLNPFISFTLEEGQKGAETGLNFNRRILGAMVDSLTLNIPQGEAISMDVSYVGQSGVFLSGAAATLETDPDTRPHLWQDVLVHIPSGTVYNEVKNFSWTLNNNIERKHYLNGSRVSDVPVPTNRDYEVSVTLDATSERTKTLYTNYFLPGSTFNMLLAVSASTGSREMFLTMSGCKLMDMEAPTNAEGDVNEQTLTIMPQTCSVLVNDEIQLYNPW